MRLGGSVVQPTPAALQRLRSWLPTSNHAFLLQDVPASQLQLLLEVATCLLGSGSPSFSKAFRDEGCLLFWRRVFDHHHGVISKEVADAFSRMMSCYTAYSTVNWQYIYDNLNTVCMWETIRHGDDLAWHITALADSDSHRDPVWQELQDTLLDLLPTEDAKDASAAFLQQLVRDTIFCVQVVRVAEIDDVA